MSGAATIHAMDDWLLISGLAGDAVLRLATRAAQSEDWTEIVPGMDSLALGFDPLSLPRETAIARAQTLRRARAPLDDAAPAPAVLHICYEEPFAPDLVATAAALDIAAEALPRWHQAQDWRVAMLGFLPGFAYLTGGDAPDLPRLGDPRSRVPAGSVGLLGRQCGLYPIEGPGGWPLIGRIAEHLFDPARDPPALLIPGQAVRFTRVDRAGFDRLRANAA